MANRKGTDPRASDGARTERESVVAHLRRELNQRGSMEAATRGIRTCVECKAETETTDVDGYALALRDVLRWMLARERRYGGRR